MKNRLKIFVIILGGYVSLYIAMTASHYINLVYYSWKEGYHILLNVDNKQSDDRFDVILSVYNSRWRWYLHLPCYKETIIHDSVHPEHLSNWSVISVKDGVINLKNNNDIILVKSACKL